MVVVSVLLVEDDEDISWLMTDRLSENGFAVHAVANGEEAMHYIEDGGRVDVLFTDVNLRGGMDGAQLASQVRQLRPELPVVYTSGRAPSGDIAALAPHAVFLAKPYDPDDACTLLARLTAQGSRA